MMAERADAKKVQEDARIKEAKEEAAMKQRKDIQMRAQEDAISRREAQRERERERQREEIEQLKRDKLELDRRSNEREKLRENRRLDERKKLEEALKEKEHIAPYQREQLRALDEKLSAPASVYQSGSDGDGTEVSARERVLQRKQDKLAKEESDRIELMKAAELDNRRLRAIANAEGRNQYRSHADISGRPTSNAMDVSELADVLKDAAKGPSRYCPISPL